MRLVIALGLALAGCSAMVPKGAAVEDCLHICGSNRACRTECLQDAGILPKDEPPEE